jgi:hypothetical protein
LTTIALSNIPDLTAAVGVPRMVAIEHPFGRLLGNPGDRERHMAVLRATLFALEGMQMPGEIRHLPFEWEEGDNVAKDHPVSPPPIVGHIIRHPWQLSRLLKRNPPG